MDPEIMTIHLKSNLSFLFNLEIKKKGKNIHLIYINKTIQ